jgi:predicted alpha/beta-hydrolase family hydrolase
LRSFAENRDHRWRLRCVAENRDDGRAIRYRFAMPTAAQQSHDQPLFLFAHGAGAPSSSAWMANWKKRLATLGPTVTFDYLYMRQGRRSPDKLPQLMATHREALADARAKHDGPVILAGKSMGSRIGCHLALEEPAVRALICFGYPLKAPGKTGAVRDEVLLGLRAPILFLQGTRDPLCPLDLLEKVRGKMTAPSTLHVVQGGDHSLTVSATALKAAGEKQADSDARVLGAITAFLERCDLRRN